MLKVNWTYNCIQLSYSLLLKSSQTYQIHQGSYCFFTWQEMCRQQLFLCHSVQINITPEQSNIELNIRKLFKLWQINVSCRLTLLQKNYLQRVYLIYKSRKRSTPFSRILLSATAYFYPRATWSTTYSSSSSMGFNGGWYPMLMAHYRHQLVVVLKKKTWDMGKMISYQIKHIN
jgi:hypothetical protein